MCITTQKCSNLQVGQHVEIQRNTKCENVTKIKDIQVANLRSNDHV